MTKEQERTIAVQDGAHKVLSGEMTAEHFFSYYVDCSLFEDVREFKALVTDRVKLMQ
jgi:hypothetical protein